MLAAVIARTDDAAAAAAGGGGAARFSYLSLGNGGAGGGGGSSGNGGGSGGGGGGGDKSKCVSALVDAYVYELCTFAGGRATQRRNDGGGSTRLGTFDGFTFHNDNDDTGKLNNNAGGGGDDSEGDGVWRLHYRGGAHCAGVGARSLTVDVVCGAETTLSAVAEPDRCVYTATLQTPGACTERAARRLRAFIDEYLPEPPTR
jgi:hypothetical protein